MLYFNKILPIKIDSDEPIVVYSLNYLLEIGKLLEQTDVKVIHNYVIWRLVRNLTPYLAGDYIQKRIDFRKVLLGVSAERVRWTQCVEMVNKRLGMLCVVCWVGSSSGVTYLCCSEVLICVLKIVYLKHSLYIIVFCFHTLSLSSYRYGGWCTVH